MTITEPGVGARVSVVPHRASSALDEMGVDVGVDLGEIVLRVAADDARWRPMVRHDVHGRRFERLTSPDDHEVWLICWDVGQMTLLHDHGPSAGAFVVVEGVLLEDYGRRGSGRLRQRRIPRGRARRFGPGYVHNLSNPGPGLATSIHVYAPRLTTMTYYAVLPGGAVPVRTLPVVKPEPTVP